MTVAVLPKAPAVPEQPVAAWRAPAIPVAESLQPANDARAPVMSEAAAPDLPVTVGVLIAGSYAALLGAFALAFATTAGAAFMIAICAVYLVMYVGAPAVLLRMEPKAGPRPDFADFLERGLVTWTGRVSAGAALAQMLTVPLAVAFGVAGIGVIIRQVA
ncbi:hypothetical protein [Phenylobacterium montanum]|uniref:Uncharacterized protein n=1 Tax=Phenylobacterium montanum TaxID=2823693 RepID=A0A975G2A7_9CAUL|nr:hypothetical protein [Caulobacter sp. S6]QUD89391.1 hypothetical protein KCG34_05790 [Caulobacter sp. S6]